jgi:hypothetical protein
LFVTNTLSGISSIQLSRLKKNRDRFLPTYQHLGMIHS